MMVRYVILTIVMLASCSSTPPQRHEYSLLLEGASNANSNDVAKTERLNIRRIDMPAFLQTRALAMQVAKNEIVLARHHSWTDRLDDSIARVLETTLLSARPKLTVIDATDVECMLDVRFDRFHAADKGEVLASGSYSLSNEGASVRREFDVSRSLAIGGYANAVTELRGSLVDLGTDIAADIETIGGCLRVTDESADESKS